MKDLPDSCIQNMIYTSTSFFAMVVLTKKTQIYIREKASNKKNYSGHAEYVLHFI